MALPSGFRLGPYEILSPLGAGGMGEVYRARDTRLGREVAIKIPPETLARDPAALARFEREARAVAALTHPNILDIHDFGNEAGATFVVTELLIGETLGERLRRGALPWRSAVEIALSIADGLAAAHGCGVVHRDLKPDNVFLAADGRVKILDFGLARRDARETSGPDRPASFSTESGVLAGTAGYISPEQVRGTRADERSDLFALGCILYEMITGRRAFGGETPAEALVATLKEEPRDPADLATIPEDVRMIILRCLAKTPEARFQSSRDLAFALKVARTAVRPLDPPASRPGAIDVASRSSNDRLPEEKAQRRSLFPGAAVALVAILLAIAGSRVFFFSKRGMDKAPSFRQLTFRRGQILSARFAPDGQTIVYGGAWDGEPVQLFTTRSEGGESSALPIPAADVLSVSSSGELAVSLGRHYLIFFATSGTLAQVPLAGGAPREILEDVQEADWSPDGAMLAVVRRVRDRHRLEFPLGKAVYTTAGWISHPRVSPDGSRIAFLDHPNYGDDRGDVAVVDRAGNKTILSTGWLSEQGLAWAPSGKEVWFSAADRGIVRSLYAIDLSGKRRQVLRMPGSLHLYDIFRDGRVLLAQETLRTGIMGLAPGQTKERDLSWHDASMAMDLTYDGRTLLISEQGGGVGPSYAVYLREMNGSPAVHLGDGLAMAVSPDKKWVLTLLPKSPPELVLLPTGAGEIRRLKRGSIVSYAYAATWFPDGRRILLRGREPGHTLRLYVQALDGEPVPISPEGVQEDDFGRSVSPDGQLVLASGPGGRAWLYPVEGRSEPQQIPEIQPNERPIGWTSDGRALYITRPSALPMNIYLLDISSRRRILWKQLSPGDPAGLISIPWAHLAGNGEAYAYTYWRVLSNLYLVDGLQ